MNEVAKKTVAKTAINYIKNIVKHPIYLGIGTGSTVNFFIQQLPIIKYNIEACISSSKDTRIRLENVGIPIADLNSIDDLHIYIDSTDEITRDRTMMKGMGGALTNEKILSAISKRFICILDETKLVKYLGRGICPLVIEVIPIAKSFVAHEIIKIGGIPKYRNGFITDHGNIILDVYNLKITNPKYIEQKINNIPGVVENGLFVRHLADEILVGTKQGRTFTLFSSL